MSSIRNLAQTDYSQCEELIIVCGHAHFRSDLPNRDPFSEASWKLKPFQRSTATKQGEHVTFCHHIIAALNLLAHPKAFLVFSGGATDPEVEHTEADSYMDAMYAILQKQPHDSHLSSSKIGSRWSAETLATDSFQNFLFSIIEFRKKTGRYPQKISVVTHDFKTQRFMLCHAQATRWPRDSIEVIGIDPIWSSPEEKQTTAAMEGKHAYLPFKTDPYGTMPLLSAKRIGRLWDKSKLNLLSSGLEPSVQKLLAWEGTELFDEPLPWSSESSQYPEDHGAVSRLSSMRFNFDPELASRVPCFRTSFAR
ncbi:hypothetical protein K461DRAFT_292013 [Myriangium duriaei CBS 260.36]|uniref:DUF218 domain-containing protein n=1 Tax=Myriangium duriaei CBS 260.36 TaxID=1168546 RepID=A0A9P4MJD9_9PEZI|nr:hypothetical protein K461DRAFT_292013 [Myriangium duriaei CBS 260.36]